MAIYCNGMKNIDGQILHGNVKMLVLFVVAEQTCHGYQIRKELAVRSRGHFRVAFGRLYPLLRSLAQRGLLKARWVKAGKIRERKQYAITSKGRAELQHRKVKWRQFCAAMDAVLSAGRLSKRARS